MSYNIKQTDSCDGKIMLLPIDIRDDGVLLYVTISPSKPDHAGDKH